MRTLLLLAALGLALPAAAQPAADAAAAPDDEAWRPTARGVRTLGGYAGGIYSRDENNREFYLAVSPSVGRFVADGLLVELELGINAGWSRVDGSGFPGESTEFRGTNVGVGLGPSVTKYFGAPDARVFPYIGASAFVRGSRFRGTEDGIRTDPVSDWDSFGEVRAGAMVPVARNVGLQARFALPVYNTVSGSPFTQTTVLFSVGVETFLY